MRTPVHPYISVNIGYFTYRDVSTQAFKYETLIYEEQGYSFMIASPEKAICDQLYTCSPCANRKELRILLFEDLRIDESALLQLNLDTMIELAPFYKTKNHRLLVSMINQIKRHLLTSIE